MTLQTPWRSLKLGSGASFEATFSHNGRLLAVIGRRVSLWDVFARRRLWISRPFPHPSNASFSPDDAVVAVKHTNGRIVTLDASGGSVIRDFANQREGQGADVSFSGCGKYLIDASEDDAAIVRRVRDGRIEYRRPLPPGAMVHTIQSMSGGQQWLIHFWKKAHADKSPPRAGYFEVWNWPFAGAATARWDAPTGRPATATPNWDGTQVALVVSGTMQLFVFEVATGKLLLELRCHPHSMAATWSRDGATLFVAEDDIVSIYEKKIVRAKKKTTPLRSIGLHMASSVTSTPQHDLVAFCSNDVGFVVDPKTAPDVLLPVPPHLKRARKLLES